MIECGFMWGGESRCANSPYWGMPGNHQCRMPLTIEDFDNDFHAEPHQCACGEICESAETAMS